MLHQCFDKDTKKLAIQLQREVIEMQIVKGGRKPASQLAHWETDKAERVEDGEDLGKGWS